jgi:hypothetical protein
MRGDGLRFSLEPRHTRCAAQVLQPAFAVDICSACCVALIVQRYLQLPPIEVEPSLHSVSMVSTLALRGAFLAADAGAAGALALPAAAALAGAGAAAGAVPGGVPGAVAGVTALALRGAPVVKYIIFLAPCAHEPTTLPAAWALLSTTVTVNPATPAA